MSRENEKKKLEMIIEDLRLKFSDDSDANQEICDRLIDLQTEYKKRYGDFYHFRKEQYNRNI